MFIKGTIEEENDEDSRVWPLMEIEITSDDKGATADFFCIGDHSNALLFFRKTLLEDKKKPALSNTTKHLIRHAIFIMNKSKPTNPSDPFITRNVTDATLMARLFTNEEERRGLLEYVITYIEEDDVEINSSTELFIGRRKTT